MGLVCPFWDGIDTLTVEAKRLHGIKRHILFKILMMNLELNGKLIAETEHLLANGDVSLALKLLEPFVNSDPPSADALHMSGRLWLDGREDAETALPLLEQAVALDESPVSYRLTLGQCLCTLGRPRQALKTLGRLPPENQDAEVAALMATAYAKAGEDQHSLAAQRRAAELDPNETKHAIALARALLQRDQLTEAITVLQVSKDRNPKDTEVRVALGSMYVSMGDLGDAIDNFQQALEIDPDQPVVHSNVVLYSQYLDVDINELIRVGRKWDAIHCSPRMPTEPTYSNPPDPDRRLRIGYVSADFKWHAVAYFLKPLLDAHDRSEFEVFCYSNKTGVDSMGAAIRESSDHWREIADLDDQTVADMIRDDGIDILFELSGYCAFNRLTLFALRPAPVQIGWPGYPGSRYVESLDYWITDDIADPLDVPVTPGIGQPLRVDGGYHVFEPDPEAHIPVAPPPCERNSLVTFGSFNHQWKIQECTVALWSQVMHAVPESRLLLKAVGFDRKETVERYQRLFETAGIGRDRIRCLGGTHVKRRHFELYGQVDVALDPFPYHGTTTTCEAWWMGVPIVTLVGDRNASRVGASLSRQMGLDDWVANTPEEYVNIAVSASKDVKRLSDVRKGLRDRMRTSSLGDAGQTAMSYQSALRRAWQTWCQQQNEDVQ